MHTITNNSIKDRGSNWILNKPGRGPPNNIHTKFATNSCIGLREGQKWVKQRSLIQRVTLTEMKYRNYKSRIRHVYVKYKSLIHSRNYAT